MFCPNCGTADQNPNAYCRRCGQWLSDQKSIKSRTANKPEDRMNAMLVFNGLSAVFGLFSAIALYATYLGTPEAKWSVYLAGACCIVIAVHQSISLFFALELKRRFKRGRAGTKQTIESKAEVGAAPLGNAETARLVNAPSVIENTTELLELVPRGEESIGSQER